MITLEASVANPLSPALLQELESQFGLVGVTHAVVDEPAIAHWGLRQHIVDDKQPRFGSRIVGANPPFQIHLSGTTVCRDAPTCGNSLVTFLPQLAVKGRIRHSPGAQSQPRGADSGVVDHGHQYAPPVIGAKDVEFPRQAL